MGWCVLGGVWHVQMGMCALGWGVACADWLVCIGDDSVHTPRKVSKQVNDATRPRLHLGPDDASPWLLGGVSIVIV